MNGFDATMYFVAIVAVVLGFNAGILRSTAKILGYLAATPIAMTTASLVSPALAGRSGAPWAENPLVLFGIFLAVGVAFGALLRTAINQTVGPSISLADRLAGSVLAAFRVGLVGVTIVLVFDRIVPVDREPEFLAGSRVRPVLLLAGQRGIKSLPPEITALIDQLKKDRQI